MNEWGKAKIKSDLAQKKIVWILNPPGAPHFWWNLGKTGSRMQEGHDCIFGQPKPHRRGAELNNVSCREDSQRKTPNSSKLRPWWFDGTHTKSFLARTRELSAPIMPSSERYHHLRKLFKTTQAYADITWKRWSREYLPQWNQRLKWSKEHVRKPKEGELVWLVDDYVKRCE